MRWVDTKRFGRNNDKNMVVVMLLAVLVVGPCTILCV